MFSEAALLLVKATTWRLMQLMVAVKEAGGSVDRVSQIKDRCDITVLSGDDGLTVPMMAVGAAGIISVASNVIPAELTKMVKAALDGGRARISARDDLRQLFYAIGELKCSGGWSKSCWGRVM